MNGSEAPGAERKDPVCGMEVNPESPFRTTYGGREYLFCSRHCLDEFQADPARYLRPPLFMDPVCGMSVKTDGEFRSLYKGHEYFFCSRHCLAEFQEDPEKFSAAPPKYYHCPRHTGVRQAEPGTCPECGMALEGVRPKWVCPYHPRVLHEAPGVCPVYGLPLIPEPPGRFYSCTLHPEVKQVEPGRCPRCGMEMQPYWAPVALVRTEWFCPAHPDLCSLTPGSCPECGWKMEPRQMPATKEAGCGGNDPSGGGKDPPEEVCSKCGLVVK
jgi:YHS domain-containing protein